MSRVRRVRVAHRKGGRGGTQKQVRELTQAPKPSDEFRIFGGEIREILIAILRNSSEGSN
jgi:hypothetical protein